MSGWTKAREYKCDNDCQPAGCPGHILAVNYHGVSDTFQVSIDSMVVLTLGENSWDTLIKIGNEPWP